MAQKRKLTAEAAAWIKWLLANTDLFQDQIAGMVNQNPGRVAEVKYGQRFPDVTAERPPWFA